PACRPANEAAVALAPEASWCRRWVGAPGFGGLTMCSASRIPEAGRSRGARPETTQLRGRGDIMFVRSTRLETPPENLDSARTLYEQQLLPAMRKLAGFQGAILASDRVTGK